MYFVKVFFALNSTIVFGLLIAFIINIFIIKNTKVVDLFSDLFITSLFDIFNIDILFCSFIDNIVLVLILYSFFNISKLY